VHINCFIKLLIETRNCGTKLLIFTLWVTSGVARGGGSPGSPSSPPLTHKKILIVLSGKSDIESYFRVTVYLPFLDTMLEPFNLRFTEKTKAAALFDVLCPKAALSISADDAEADFLTLWKIYSPALHANNVEPLDTVGIKSLSEFKQWCSK
jgi:hypothetical protein